MPRISTALLNESVTIQSLSGSSVDDRGLSTASFGSGTSVNARIVYTGSVTESDAESREETNEQIKIIVPPTTSVTVANRLVYDSNSYNIRDIKSVKDRFGNTFYKELLCESGY